MAFFTVVWFYFLLSLPYLPLLSISPPISLSSSLLSLSLSLYIFFLLNVAVTILTAAQQPIPHRPGAILLAPLALTRRSRAPARVRADRPSTARRPRMVLLIPLRRQAAEHPARRAQQRPWLAVLAAELPHAHPGRLWRRRVLSKPPGPGPDPRSVPREADRWVPAF
ncbi:uncharacterized protein K452DRAFT_60224 [Aplosporella prunicola CBS 121167]|uniref:Uncharacterized protein n=1 Tax=Aplosporella prunicola CBS 121167 TaxID=1176127 RepID=A0A6A6B7C8_9PEZI|nr:uncharacterized protein K452DRAFT_60224 [Aplosporella prunicola CBS 121167]KAF2140062.1 hypothetical protein K452DRAFT_60224 [Aplosporella prunicola CBS 121167]